MAIRVSGKRAVSEIKAPKPSEPRAAPKTVFKVFKGCNNMVISKIDA